ncbi:MAG: TrkH family potassium uptake protein [Bacteroidales bacterium]|nr:TrkH family potassium uptake protein [Candidatus Colimorpha onthohippi]
MNYRCVFQLLSLLLIVEAVVMIGCGVLSWFVGDGAVAGFGIAALVVLIVALSLRMAAGRHVRYQLSERDSFWVTSLAWIVVPVMGCLPFMLTGQAHRWVDALFESFSGFTTTGSTIFDDPACLPISVLVWRSLTQWVGGLGLVLLMVALMRRISHGTWYLYDAEFSGTQQRRLYPKLSGSVGRMAIVYVSVSLALVFILLLLGNNPIDSVCLALSTTSTGGFMTSSVGLAGLGNATLIVITLFMFMSGVNLAVIYNVVTFKWRRLHRLDEFRAYVVVYFVAVALSVIALLLAHNDWRSAVGFSLFHIASTISTCGFYAYSPAHWTFGVSVITFFLLFVGASSGATGGGVKVKRILVLTRYIRNYFTRIVYPHAVFNVKVDGMVLTDEYNNKVFAFVFTYLAFVLGGAFLLTLSGCDIPTSVTLAAANMCNLGPVPVDGLLGVSASYLALPTLSKYTLMVLMVAGRIEIFALLAIFSPAYWRKK